MFRRILSASAIVLAATASSQAAVRDAIDLSQVTVYNSPADVASWPVTTAITELHMRPEGASPTGLSLVFSAQQTWPDYTPPGWSGPLQYTVWPVVKVGGQYYTSGIIQMWRGRASTGAPLPAEWYNWAYDSRWGAMNCAPDQNHVCHGYQPQVGEVVGFFVTAGNARGVPTVTSVRERSNVVLISMPAGNNGDWTFSSSFRTTAGDADGDGKSDIGVFRPSTGQWFGLASSTGFNSSANVTWGTNGDIPVPADYDGDGKTDIGVFRPSDGSWHILLSSANYTTSLSVNWGTSGDIPAPADYDGDGRADITVFRPSSGTWYVIWSKTGATASGQFGTAGDVPVPADFDGDGIADFAVFRPSSGVWYAMSSRAGGYSAVRWGAAGDIPVAADYDGDGKAEVAVFRQGMWYVIWSRTGVASSGAWGTAGDIPVPGDYDGDGRTDFAVYRPSNGTWYISRSTNGTIAAYVWGMSGDVPLLGR